MNFSVAVFADNIASRRVLDKIGRASNSMASRTRGTPNAAGSTVAALHCLRTECRQHGRATERPKELFWWTCLTLRTGRIFRHSHDRAAAALSQLRRDQGQPSTAPALLLGPSDRRTPVAEVRGESGHPAPHL